MNRDWKTLISSLTSDAEVGAAAGRKDLESIERELGVRLPEDLSSLLSQADGVRGEYGLGLVWPTSRILKDNRSFRASTEFRDLYMPFEPLLFFADAGNGDQFAYTICNGNVRPDIFVWDHETDSRSWAAGNLAQYLEWWLSGKLKV